MMASGQDRPSYLFIVNWSVEGPGGVNEAVFGLANEIGKAKGGYHPIVATATWTDQPAPAVVRNTEIASFRLRDPMAAGARATLGALTTLPSDLSRLSRFLRDRNVQVVNAHFPNASVYAFFVLRALGLYRGRIVLSFHGSDVANIAAMEGSRKRMWCALIRQADLVVTCSRDLGNKVESLVPDANIRAIYNGADLSGFDEPRPQRAVRHSILHVGRYELKKAQDVLLRAFRRLLGAIPEAKLTLVGTDGPARASIEELVSELGLHDRVSMFRDLPHDQISGFMSQADLFVLPSRSEPFGIVLLEAGAAGLPVVATNVGGIPELIEDGVTGLLVPPDDELRLEAAMRDLLLDTGKADRLADSWRAHSLREWSWRRAADEYIKALNGKAPLNGRPPTSL